MAGLLDSRRSLWLCCPPVLLCTIDSVLTWYGQPRGYWDGNYTLAQEQSPVFNELLKYSPIAAAVGTLAWLCIMVLLILLLPCTVSLIFSVGVTFGHAVGASSWLLYRIPYGYNAFLVLIFLTSTLVVLTLRKGESENGSPAVDWTRIGFPEWSRWVAITFLIALAVGLFVRM